MTSASSSSTSHVDLQNRPRLTLPVSGLESRPALSERHLLDLVDQHVNRGRPITSGVLAIVQVAEMTRLRSRLGPQADQAIAGAFDAFFAPDAENSEEHAVRSGDSGFWLFMPTTDSGTARKRLRKLSARVINTVLDIGGEQVRITPVVGFAILERATSASELGSRATDALGQAFLHLDLVPVGFTPEMAMTHQPVATRDRLVALLERLRTPLQVLSTLAFLLGLPFIVYVIVWHAGFDLTSVTYPLMAAALTGTAAAMWIESFMAIGAVAVPAEPQSPFPPATAIIAAYLPNEAATIVDTVTNMLRQDYPGELQVILAYNSPQHLPIETILEELAFQDPRLLLLKVDHSTSKAQNVNAALAHVEGEFVGIFDADHHPQPGSFSRAWRWLSNGHDIVQGHCVVRTGEASWVSRMVAVEFETIYAVSHPGRARLHRFGIFGGSNGYWRRDALRQIRMQRLMLTEDIDSSMRSLRNGFNIVSDPGLISTELAPTTVEALWHQRMRWAQGWTQTAWRHFGPILGSDRLTKRQKIGASFLLGWAQLVPWVTIQLVPILCFAIWRDRGINHLDFLLPLFVLLTLFTFSVGPAQAVFGYLLGDSNIRRHKRWFGIYAIHSMIWFAEFKNLIARVAQLKELIGERQWRVTPRTSAARMIEDELSERSEFARRAE
jgi:cellulose synthase/poly-beta-1,6-N-acetylglucosamine synthase-like glycosyltransferase